MNRPLPINTESTFSFNEIIFSSTDKKGIIKTGNEVFMRVSKYSRDEIYGRPHNQVRHPDMPKAIFKILWDHISQNKTLAAYVKNLAADGSYYWVLALVIPIETGYASLRIKPSSELFETVKTVYQELLEIESKSSIETSVNHLMSKLQKMGYPTIESFSQQILASELKSRDLLYQSSDSVKVLADLRNMFTGIEQIENTTKDFFKYSKEILTRCQRLNHLSINMMAESERVGIEGRTMTVVSNQFRTWSQDIQNASQGFAEEMNKLRNIVNLGLFLVSTSRIQVEMTETIRQEGKSLELNNTMTSDLRTEFDNNRNLLTDIINTSLKEVDTLLHQVGESFQSWHDSLGEIQSSMVAMEVVRLSGRMESVRNTTSEAAFANHIQGMADFVTTLRTIFKKFDEEYAPIQDNLKSIIQSTNEIASYMKVEEAGIEFF